MKFRIFNYSLVNTDLIIEWVTSCIFNKSLPKFYLIIAKSDFDGITITNLDKPTILLIYDNPTQFKRVLLHELVHLVQHQNGYTNEEEAEKEVIK